MGKRALLIGSETGGLAGVHRDVDVLAETLRGHDFEVRKIIESEATAEGIVRSYEELIDDSTADDAAMIYYSGHGSRSVNPTSDGDPSLPRQLQFIVPTDIDDRSGGVFRGLLAEELSALQRRLTDTCPNVTTILDCCHSARMFRDRSVLPRASDRFGFPWDDLTARWQEVRDDAGDDLGDVNPLAVQVVACEPHQSAYELAESSLGGPHGALTSELVTVLRRPDALRLTWREMIEIVRPAILDVVPSQRPDVLGPQAERVLFSLETRSTTGVLRVTQQGDEVWVEDAALFGVAEGDTYALVAPGGDADAPLAEGIVELVQGDRARLLISAGATPELPPGTLAHPRDVSLGRRPIVVRPAGHPDRATLVDGLRGSPRVRVVDGDRAGGVLAAVELGDDGMQLLDAQEQPLWAAPRPVSTGTVGLLDRALATMARATHLRDLESGSGGAALTDTATERVSVTWWRLDPADGHEVPIEPGDHLHVGDSVVVRARNSTSERRYLSVLDIGLTGAIGIMTNSQPSGVTIEPGEEYVVGENAAHVVEGIELFWPEGLPDEAARAESLIVLVADRPIDALPSLAQDGVAVRSAAKRSGGIDRLLEDVTTGMRDGRPPQASATTTRYRVERFDFVLQPTPRPTTLGEPTFEIDTRPDPSFRLIVPRNAGAAPPEHVSVRLSELTVHSNRSLLRSKVRIDFLAVTAAGGASVEPWVATTSHFDRVKDGDRLPLDNMMLYDGPVARFIDLAVWVSKADDQEVTLAELLRKELADTDVAAAVTTLAALALPAPAAAAVAASAAAVATLMHTGAKVLSAINGTSIGVYRTALLPHERFGAGNPARRHPADGVIRAQDMSLAFEIVDADAAG